MLIYACPNCTSRTPAPTGKPVLHRCRGLKGLIVPMVIEGTSCKLEIVERGDYVAGEHVQTDAEGRPVMSVVTTRDDGQDCTVYAPAASATAD